LTLVRDVPIIQMQMASTTRKTPAKRGAAERRAAKVAEELADALHSFATTLRALETSAVAKAKPTPRNWWRTQVGRFDDDPTFPEFVARVRAARRKEG
jgi:hypothetical protein